ncbi:MAG: c-type cytochrome [Tepidisphaeraceae bacterium]
MTLRQGTFHRAGRTHFWRRPAIVIAAGALLFGFGCDAKSDMGEQPKYKTYTPNDRYADNASARPLVAGVVPRDPMTVPGGPYATTVQLNPAGTAGTIDPATRIPVPITDALLHRGQQQFDIYCSACHGRLGNGEGMVAQRGFQHPPSYHIPRLKAVPDGHFYNVITAGYGAMYSYCDKVAPADRWAIIAYIRALQAAPDVANADAKTRATLYGLGDIHAKTVGWHQ